MLHITPNVYALFWLEAGQPRVQTYDSNEMVICMTDAEKLRGRKRMGENVSHINFCSEHPDRVGDDGVADPNSNYSSNHWKRRVDPNTPLGRNSRNLS